MPYNDPEMQKAWKAGYAAGVRSKATKDSVNEQRRAWRAKKAGPPAPRPPAAQPDQLAPPPDEPGVVHKFIEGKWHTFVEVTDAPDENHKRGYTHLVQRMSPTDVWNPDLQQFTRTGLTNPQP
jgi:hypothetical protein